MLELEGRSVPGAFESFLHLNRFPNQIQFSQYRIPYDKTFPYLAPEKSALDWGCGNGHFSQFLLHYHQATTAFGFGETHAPHFLAGNPLLTFVPGDLSVPVKLSFADSSFDLVFSMGVLEHVHESGGDQILSLNEIRRILKPGGYFLCFHFPYVGSWVETVSKALMPLRRTKKYVHTRRFSRSDVERLSKESRLSLQEWGRYNFLPRNFTQKLPVSIADNPLVVSTFNKLDAVFTFLFPFLCNQSFFIARKQKES